jgi:hypothetical protein
MDQLMQLSKDEVVSLFNGELSTFLSELVKIFSKMTVDQGSFNQLLSYKSLIETGINSNKEIGSDMFAGYIFSSGNDGFMEKISSRDYDFFYKMEEKIASTNKFAEVLLIVKHLFIQLSDTNKENIFGYLENLALLANVYAMKKLGK